MLAEEGGRKVSFRGRLFFRIGNYLSEFSAALRCGAEEESIKTSNETTNKLESKEMVNSTEEDGYGQDLSTLMNSLQQKCPCPCKGVPNLPVCGKTTNGQLKTFESQCHLICHNQCESSESKDIFLKLLLAMSLKRP